jgi:hypothetical protein
MPSARTPIVMLTLVMSLLVSPGAQAKRVLVPPGNSGASQYVEVVPSAEGGVTPAARSQNHSRVLTRQVEQRLKATGAEGKAVAAFAQATGTPTQNPSAISHNSNTAGTHGHRGSGGAVGGGSQLPPGPGTISQAASVSSGSLGWGLPLALGLIALAAVALLLRRRRSG